MFKTSEERHIFYQSKNWKNLRSFVLANEPLCRECKKEGKLTEATDCDHILPIVTHPELRLEHSNIQPLCKHHHMKKTFEEAKERIQEGREKAKTKPKLKWL